MTVLNVIILVLIIIGCGGIAFTGIFFFTKKYILDNEFIGTLIFYLLFTVCLIIAAILISVFQKNM